MKVKSFPTKNISQVIIIASSERQSAEKKDDEQKNKNEQQWPLKKVDEKKGEGVERKVCVRWKEQNYG